MPLKELKKQTTNFWCLDFCIQFHYENRIGSYLWEKSPNDYSQAKQVTRLAKIWLSRVHCGTCVPVLLGPTRWSPGPYYIVKALDHPSLPSNWLPHHPVVLFSPAQINFHSQTCTPPLYIIQKILNTLLLLSFPTPNKYIVRVMK